MFVNLYSNMIIFYHPAENEGWVFRIAFWVKDLSL